MAQMAVARWASGRDTQAMTDDEISNSTKPRQTRKRSSDVTWKPTSLDEVVGISSFAFGLASAELPKGTVGALMAMLPASQHKTN